MRAVVLVGGFGTRLRPLTTAVPKQMLPVVDRPMIEHVLAGLRRHGITEAVLALGFQPDAFIDAYPDGECAGVSLVYAVEPEPLDTAGAIRFAAAEAGIEERFVAVNGDVFTDLDLTELIAFHDRSGAEASIALTPVEDPSRYGVVPTDDHGRVLGFIEKPPADEAPTKWINAGTYVLEPSVLDRIDPDRRVSIERETFPALVADGTLFALQSDAYWVDAGTAATYIQVQLDLIDGRRAEVLPAIAADARCDASATVESSVIGADAVLDAGAQVRRSVIGQGAKVGRNATVADSIIAPHAEVGDGANVHDFSIVGVRERVAPGTVLRDARVPATTP
ncbi:MAG: NDP-sugar synthase [Acidimicrobiia bacterium]|nr:NDP-sugar synthase [Acidimicrobiia bacterium]MDH5238483.1 NDP-sugar synthase [Acidimicrobiia bacterium]